MLLGVFKGDIPLICNEEGTAKRPREPGVPWKTKAYKRVNAFVIA